MANKKKLDDIERQVKSKKRPTATVRELLSWFDSQRRGSWVVATVRRELESRDLTTEPDFESAWYDGEVTFVLLSKQIEPATDAAEASEEVPGLPNTAIPRVGALLGEQKGLVSIQREATLEQATTLMLMHDFSQLPVMPGSKSRTHHGMISWRSIGQARLLQASCTQVGHCMEPAESLSVGDSIYRAIEVIQSRDAVLVRNAEREIVGILTAADITGQFRRLSEPYLLIGEIETHLRRIIARRITPTDLATWKDPSDEARKVALVSDLSFGETIRGLDRPGTWERLGLCLDRPLFLHRLREVGRIRNEVMHFHPDAMSPGDGEILRQTSELVQRIDQVTDRRS